MATQVSERGQITIDRAAGQQLGIRPGMVAYQRVVSGRLEVVFLPAPHCRSPSGVLHCVGKKPGTLTGDDLEEIDLPAQENIVTVGFEKAEAQAALTACALLISAASFGDALIAACARSAGLQEIYTFDQRLVRAGITPVTPP